MIHTRNGRKVEIDEDLRDGMTHSGSRIPTGAISASTEQSPYRRKPPAPRPLGPNIQVAAALALASLAVGMAGYMFFERMGSVDAFLNAAMILGGMGPVGTISTTGGKIFAGLYALYSGLVVLITAGLILAPVLHNVLHRFHLGDDDDKT
ncbi:MAG: hypothetical protein HOO99_02690 [Hyphomicrobiaceae bacterium]|nr:hypothetical protein [Hyphomicrobiaceae bacterium]